MKKNSRRLGWMLVFIAALIVAILISGVAIRGRSLAPKLPTVAQGLSAREAYDLVTGWAPEWLPDAVVVRMTTTHAPARGEVDGWTFQVYSSSRKVLAAVRVESQEVAVLRETAALFVQEPLPAAAWRLDSSEALQLWWEHGGQAAWERPDAESISLRLGLNADSRLTWQVTVSWAQGEQLGFWEIDADSGEILSESEGG